MYLYDKRQQSSPSAGDQRPQQKDTTEVQLWACEESLVGLTERLWFSKSEAHHNPWVV